MLDLNISFNFYFVSKLSTNKGLFLIWINISELCAVPDVDQEHLPGEFGKFETERRDHGDKISRCDYACDDSLIKKE